MATKSDLHLSLSLFFLYLLVDLFPKVLSYLGSEL